MHTTGMPMLKTKDASTRRYWSLNIEIRVRVKIELKGIATTNMYTI
jgi:hypothetical protein